MAGQAGTGRGVDGGVGGGWGGSEKKSICLDFVLLKKKKIGVVCFSSVYLGFYCFWKSKNVSIGQGKSHAAFPHWESRPTEVDVGPQLPI